MSIINKVGNIINKKLNKIKNDDNNKYKPAGVHVLGEDDFPQSLMISEDSLSPDFQENEKQPSVIISGSSNIIPYIEEHKNLNQNDEVQKPQMDKKDKKEEPDIYKGFILMNGEKKFRTDNCFIKIDDKNFPCKLILTHYRVFIIPDFTKKEQNDFSYMNYFPDNFFSLFIHKIDKAIRTSNDKSFDFVIDIIMKDQRTFTLIFKTNSGTNFLYQLNGIIALREHNFSNIAIEYRKNNPIYKKENFEDGWNLYNPEEEYSRQGVSKLDYEVSRDKLFRKTKLNENYSLCPSYPKFLITVGEITDSDYKCSAEFRTKSRLPTLAYYHYSTGGNIWRSAQTRSGISGNRNRFDEDLLLSIAKVSKVKKLYIYDCRPYLSAVANKFKGAGYENTENYPGSEIFFCEIDNIHSARNAINKIYSMLKSNRFSEKKSFFGNFESSGWPSFIFGIILACINITSAVRKGYSVLIHCSDGWDRCSQLTAFSQLLIDPYFRTIKGYMTLIEKDFLTFGHQFRLRNGYYSKEEKSENQTSPILLQFLDATHQLLVQYPMYFEFNMKFLLFIANNINSGLYGTFLYDSEKDREKNNAKTKTMSCWTEILNNINIYKNKFYEEKSKKIYFFTPNFPMSRIRLWEEYFFPFTQISLNISYDNYINRFQENFYFNIFGQMKQKSRIISNVQYIIKEKDNEEKSKNNLLKEIKKLKSTISELTIKNNVNKEFYEGLTKETKNIINSIAKEEGGELTLNQELNMYCFKEIEKPQEIKEEEEEKIEQETNNKIFEENDEKKEDIKKEKKEDIKKEDKKEDIKKEVIKKEDQKIRNPIFARKDKEEEKIKIEKGGNKKIPSINKSKIDMFFGLNRNHNNEKSNNINKRENSKDNNRIKEKNFENEKEEQIKTTEKNDIKENKKEKGNEEESNIKEEKKEEIKGEIKEEIKEIKSDEVIEHEVKMDNIEKNNEKEKYDEEEKNDDVEKKENEKNEEIAQNENEKNDEVEKNKNNEKQKINEKEEDINYVEKNNENKEEKEVEKEKIEEEEKKEEEVNESKEEKIIGDENTNEKRLNNENVEHKDNNEIEEYQINKQNGEEEKKEN